MSNKSFNAGFAVVDFTIDFVKHLPSGFCHVGREIKNDVVSVGSVVTGFFAGMKQAVKVHAGKCKLIEREGEK